MEIREIHEQSRRSYGAPRVTGQLRRRVGHNRIARLMAGIRDLCDKTLTGWSMGERQSSDLVIAALVMAFGRRQPAIDLVHPADRGSQSTALEFTKRLQDWGLVGSYGSVGDC